MANTHHVGWLGHTPHIGWYRSASGARSGLGGHWRTRNHPEVRAWMERMARESLGNRFDTVDEAWEYLTTDRKR